MLFGPGTDLDIRGVYQSGQAILNGHYQVSRVPGSPVFEALSGVLHAVGGSFAVNFVSGLMALALALAVAVLVAQELPARSVSASWLGLVVLLNPFIWVAGTSMVDFVWAMAAIGWGVVAQRRRHWSMAVFYALAVGVRASSAFVVLAFLLVDFVSATATDRRWIAKFAGCSALLAVLAFLPPFLTLGSSFLRTDVEAASLFSHVGRAAIKSWYFYGPVMVGLVLWVFIWRFQSVRQAWHNQPLFRMALVALVVVQLLYVRYPWKLAHLIPAFAMLVLLGGLIPGLGKKTLLVFVASQLILGAVNLNLAQPDQPNAATSGRFSPQLLVGPLVRDVQCRLDSNRTLYKLPAPDDEGGVGSDLLEIWACVVPWSHE